MMILNLADLEKSDIKYKISKFPDGQQNLNIEVPKHYDLASQGLVQIRSRLNNFLDLELLICTTKSLRNLGVKDISLYVPYFLGSRSDRKFEEGGNNYLKDVICPIINSLEFDSVITVDPHSYVLEACLNNFRTGTLNDFYDSAYKELGLNKDNAVVISPDAGAQKRVELAAKQMRINDIITAYKEREKDGTLVYCRLPIGSRDLSKNIVIVDDICDGGGTFINIAKEIKSHRMRFTESELNSGKLYLIVTHGIFSKGFGELQQYFDGIYTTNSYKDLDMQPFVKQFKII